MTHRLFALVLATATLSMIVTSSAMNTGIPEPLRPTTSPKATSEIANFSELNPTTDTTSTQSVQSNHVPRIPHSKHSFDRTDTCEGEGNKYQCRSPSSDGASKFCVPSVWRCDGVSDCPAGDDEERCDELPCPKGFFRCASGQCVSPTQPDEYFPDNCVFVGDNDGPWSRACPTPFFRCDASQCLLPSVRCNGIAECYDGKDEIGCVGRPCARGQFNCGGGHCLRAEARCDGREDCRDGVDEVGCAKRTCTEEEFDCGDICGDLSYRCDGVDNCATGADEVGCDSGCNELDEFHCGNGTCIRGTDRCDGISDCSDDSDEKDCDIRCSKYEFSCGNTCIPLESRCDGVRDCLNFQDEAECQRRCEGTPSSSCALPPLCIGNLAFCKIDNFDNPPPTTVTCPVGKFACDGFCLDSALRCDGVQHCKDLADETGCSAQPCMPGEFLCDNGRCMNTQLRCDGSADCGDASDEAHCTCAMDELACGPRGECVPLTSVCDGRADCASGLDEADCALGDIFLCENSFPCDGNRCVKDFEVCDGLPNCRDGTDERIELCKSCEPGNFLCDDRCLPASAFCDRIPDCADGNDEGEAMCEYRGRWSPMATYGVGATAGDVALALRRLDFLNATLQSGDMSKAAQTLGRVVQGLTGGY